MQRNLRSILIVLCLGFLDTSAVAAEEDAEVIARAVQFVEITKQTQETYQAMQGPLYRYQGYLFGLNPGRGEDVEELWDSYFIPQLKQKMPELNDRLGKLYAQHFTADEFDEIITFFQSPVGQKLIRKNRVLTRKVNNLSGSWANYTVKEITSGLGAFVEPIGLEVPLK